MNWRGDLALPENTFYSPSCFHFFFVVVVPIHFLFPFITFQNEVWTSVSCVKVLAFILSLAISSSGEAYGGWLLWVYLLTPYRTWNRYSTIPNNCADVILINHMLKSIISLFFPKLAVRLHNIFTSFLSGVISA